MDSRVRDTKLPSIKNFPASIGLTNERSLVVARSSKSSKGSTKQSEETDQTGKDEFEIAADQVATESVDPESFADTDAATSTEEGSGSVEEAVVEEDAEAKAEASELPSGAEATTETAAEPESPAVPGVIPAHAPSVEPSAPPPPPVPASSGPGTFGLVFGGLLAGAIGFLVATFAVPEGWPNPAPSGLDALQSTLEEQTGKLEALTAEVTEIRNSASTAPSAGEAPDLSPLMDQLAGFESQLADTAASFETQIGALSGEIDGFEARLAELEARPVAPTGPDGSAAMEAQLEAFRQQLDEVTADAEQRITEAQDRASAIEAEAAEAAETARRQAALSSLKAALDSGAAFTELLSDLPDVPEPLASAAESGVPTLTGLQNGFPDVAREALSQVQVVPEEASTGERFVAFLKRRTNARSLTPRDGDDPDAVLSRAEAALSNGDLGLVLDELSALPEAARGAMSAWISAAETRVSALNAFTSLETANN